MRLAIPLAIVGSLVVACRGPTARAPESKRTPTDAAALLDTCVARAKELDSFDALYRLRSRDKTGLGEMRFAFQRDVGMRLDLRMAGAGMDCYYHDEHLTFRGTRPGGEPFQGDLDLNAFLVVPRRAFHAVVARELPELALPSADFRPVFDFDYTRDAAPGKAFEWRVGVLDSVKCALGWLPRLKRFAEHTELRGSTLTFVLEEGVELDLDVDSGFITSVRSTRGGPLVEHMALERLDATTPIDRSVFQPPPADPSVEDESASIAAPFMSNWVVMEERELCRAFSSLVERGELAFDDAGAKRFASLARALHEQYMELRLGGWVRNVQTTIDEFSSWVAQARESAEGAEADKDGEGLADAIRTWRQELGKHLDETEVNLRRYRASPPSVAAPDERSATLEALAREGESAAFASRVRAPLLARFDAKTGGVATTPATEPK